MLAIDQTEVTDVLNLGHSVLSRVGCVKISSHLVQRMPPGRAFDFVRNHRTRSIFYDARFVDDRAENLAADIRLVSGDERATSRYTPPALVSVHHAVGFRGVQRAVEAAEGKLEIVVFLSSSNWDPGEYHNMYGFGPDDLVARYARIAAEAGARSIMCAAIDAPVIKDHPDTRHLNVYGTGVRMEGDAVGEHKRIITPEAALANGVTHVVIGGPIVRATNPESALSRYGAIIG